MEGQAYEKEVAIVKVRDNEGVNKYLGGFIS